MPWRRETVMDQRIEFVLRVAGRRESMSQLCREYGISRPTGYLWWKRYQEAGSVTGLAERSRRPHRSPNKTADDAEDGVVGLREQFGWGARKIEWFLGGEGAKLQTRTIHRILERRG